MERSPALVLTLVSVSLPGGTRWRLRGKDRQQFTSVISAEVQVGPEQMLGSPESFLFFICVCPPPLFFFLIFFLSLDQVAENEAI